MGIVVIGDVFIDIKGYSLSPYIPQGRNAGTVIQIHGGVARNVAENIANIELKPTFISAVDNNAMGDDVIEKLKRHKVETKYMKKVENGREHGLPFSTMKEMLSPPFPRDRIISRSSRSSMSMGTRSSRTRTASRSRSTRIRRS